MANEAHGMTRKKVFYGIYSCVFFVCLRGNHIRLYQIEAALAGCCITALNNSALNKRH
jgi:hypothetical protein